MEGGPLTRPIVEAFDALSPQLQTAARYMLDCPDDVALLSMREQARRAGVPPATMTRLAKRLGLEGYDEVRALYAGAVRDGTLGFAGKAGVQVEAQKLRGERALAADMALTLSRQIARLAETPTLDRLADAAGRLHQARRIYCLGLRSCHAIAWHFHYMLSLLGDKTVMLDDAGGIGLDAIRDAGEQRRSCWPPASSPMPAPPSRARAMPHRQGVPVVALTDSEVSPLAQIAVAIIPAATDSPSFFHTMTPLLAVAEILAALVAGRSGAEGARGAEPHRSRSSPRSASICRAAARRRDHDPHPASPDRRSLPVAVGGKGIELIDSTGKRYIDASGGAAVSCLGHGHPAVTAALHEQLDKLAYAHTSFFTTEVAEKLADRLIADAPAGLSHVYLVSGGSEAVEAALKMARQYFVERGETRRRHIIARRQSYHGNTLGALAAGGNAWRRAPFAPLLIETHHIEPCFAYRFQAPGESEEQYGLRAADALERQDSRARPRARCWPSSPRPWSAPPPARCRRPRATSSACARSATATACC